MDTIENLVIRKTEMFELIFPLTFNMPDGSSVIVEGDSEDSWDQIKTWYEVNPDSEEKPQMQFPLSFSMKMIPIL